MKPLYIFDLDGTLALIKHRRHFVEGTTKDWRAFFAACVDDVPDMPSATVVYLDNLPGVTALPDMPSATDVRLDNMTGLDK